MVKIGNEQREAVIKNKVVFVSVPYSKDPVKGRELSILGSKLVKYLEGIPFSPILNFEPIFNNDTEYKDVMTACKALLFVCDEAIFITEDGDLSNGQSIEYEECNKHNKPIKMLGIDTINKHLNKEVPQDV